ncbi:MAG: ABC transporter permease [Nitrososphaerales archaeon]|jgi:ABC-2 type transport system permease protein
MFSIRRTLADLSVFGKGYIRSRVGAFFTLVFPVILILLFGAIFSGGGGASTVYVQNRDTSLSCTGEVPGNSICASSMFISAMNSTTAITLVPVPVSDNFSQYLLSQSSSDGIIIPANFTADYIQHKPVNVTVYGNPASTTSAIVKEITASVVNSFNLYGGAPVVGIKSATVASSSYKYIDFLIPGLIGFAVLMSPMFALVNISSTYKRDKVFKALSLTPLTKTEWLVSKILWYIVMTLISFCLMVATGVLLFGAHITLSLGVLPFLVLGPLLFVSLGMLVGTSSNTPESAAVVGNLITFPMMFLSGTFFPVDSMPAYLQTIAHVLPLYYVIEGLTNVMIYGNYGAALIDLGVILIIAVIIFGLAVRLFKWRED